MQISFINYRPLIRQDFLYKKGSGKSRYMEKYSSSASLSLSNADRIKENETLSPDTSLDESSVSSLQFMSLPRPLQVVHPDVGVTSLMTSLTSHRQDRAPDLPHQSSSFSTSVSGKFILPCGTSWILKPTLLPYPAATQTTNSCF